MKPNTTKTPYSLIVWTLKLCESAINTFLYTNTSIFPGKQKVDFDSIVAMPMIF